MQLFPALSQAREEFLNSIVNTEEDERSNSVEKFKITSNVKLPSVHSQSPKKTLESMLKKESMSKLRVVTK